VMSGRTENLVSPDEDFSAVVLKRLINRQPYGKIRRVADQWARRRAASLLRFVFSLMISSIA
jgi:hypothetical protein